MRYTNPMSLNAGINVRLDPSIRARLQALARKSGIKASVLIRQAVEEYCSNIEAAGTIAFTIHASRGSQVATHGATIQNGNATHKKRKAKL